MGICANTRFTCHDQSFFRKEGVFDPHLPHFKIIRDPLLLGVLSHAFTMFCRFNVLIRRKMIGDKRNFILIKYCLFI